MAIIRVHIETVTSRARCFALATLLQMRDMEQKGASLLRLAIAPKGWTRVALIIVRDGLQSRGAGVIDQTVMTI